MPRTRHDRETVLAAVRASGGYLKGAAEILGCDEQTVSDWIWRDEEIRRAFGSVRIAADLPLQALRRGITCPACGGDGVYDDVRQYEAVWVAPGVEVTRTTRVVHRCPACLGSGRRPHSLRRPPQRRLRGVRP